MTSSVHETIAVDLDLIDLYKDLHGNPELGFHEHRTSSLVEGHLTALGFDTTTGVGTTGVVGVLKNGAGPTALLRADMDALPVREETGLDYASTVTTTDDQGKTVSVSHACGHDLHTTCLLGAARILSQDTTTWSGTLVLVFHCSCCFWWCDLQFCGQCAEHQFPHSCRLSLIHLIGRLR